MTGEIYKKKEGTAMKHSDSILDEVNLKDLPSHLQSSGSTSPFLIEPRLYSELHEFWCILHTFMQGFLIEWERDPLLLPLPERAVRLVHEALLSARSNGSFLRVGSCR